MRINKSIRGNRGQVMVLGVMGVLAVALMMLLTLNVGQAIYEKIRVQQVSDSAAFSTATLEARAFNFFAYTNRANVAGLVAGASAHGFMSLSSLLPGYYLVGSENFAAMSGMEYALCATCCNLDCCCATCRHCVHGFKDDLVAGYYTIKYFKFKKKFQKTNQPFIDAIKKLDLHMKFIATQQREMKEFVRLKLADNGVAQSLLDKYSPGARLPAIAGGVGGISGLNTKEYSDAFEGDEKIVKYVATEAGNASRYGSVVKNFVAKRNVAMANTFYHTSTLKEIFKTIPKKFTNGHSLIVWSKGESRVVKKGTGVKKEIKSKQHGPDGQALGGYDYGWLGSHAYEFASGMEAEARVGSNYNSGEHKCYIDWFIPYSCCKVKSKHKDAFKCMGTKGVLIHNCFMAFKANDDPTDDFGQPRVYEVVLQDLRRTKGQGNKKPWEVTSDDTGTVAVDLGGDIGKKEVQLSDNPSADPRGNSLDEGVTLSKALVYYHLPNFTNLKGWKEQPNFFNPYWKAKLQPFRDTVEVTKVLTAAKPALALKYKAVIAMGSSLGGLPLP